MKKISTLADLKLVKKELRAHAAREAAQALLQAQAAQEAKAARNLFQNAVGKVQPLAPAKRADLAMPRPAPVAKQQQLDDAAALQEAISDDMDVSRLLDTDDHLSFRRPGVGTDVTQNLRKGKWSIQKQIDLHGLRSDEARTALGVFIREAHQQGLRCVRVVHGKGLGSPGKTPVLKDKVHRWLVQKNEVVAFVQAQPAHGGAGALLVLLQPLRTPLRTPSPMSAPL
jgi:DNA-nicking Smr family endonuclease